MGEDMPLKVSLKPGEKVIINQTVIQNGSHKTELTILNKASILRNKEIIAEDELDCLEKRIYYLIQMSYVFPDTTAVRLEELSPLLIQYLQQSPHKEQEVNDLVTLLKEHKRYNALRIARTFIKERQHALQK